ncbi:MAG TPA: hypothetical protein VMJ52_18350 [Xanthobacteraceae bacterium]|nr:hypothetical protein [Xanthobacteraceae bacterium]
MSRDCTDPLVTKELEIISVELVEKAGALEAEYALPKASDDDADVVCGED